MRQPPVRIDIETAFRHGQELYRSGRLTEAEVVYQAILQRQPNHFAALHLLGVIAFQTGRPERAVQLIGEAIAVNPDSAEAHNNRGTALRVLGCYPEALSHYDKAIALGPNHAGAHYNRGTTLRNLGLLQDALFSYDTAIALKPDFVEAHYNRGNALRDLGLPEDALASYDQAIALKPNSAEAHNNRGKALRELKRFEAALSSYDRAIELKPELAEAYNNRANTFGDLSRPDDALPDYNKAIELNPAFAEAHNNLGAALEHLGRPEEALASYDRAIALKPDFAEAHNNRGNALAHLGRLETALSSYDMAIALKRDYAEAHDNRGSTLAGLGEFESALSSYDQSIALKRDYAEARQNRAGTLGAFEDDPSGDDQPVTLTPDSADTDNNRANVLRGLGRHEEAMADYRRAIALKPDYAEAHWNQSLCQLAMGDYENGWKNFEWRWKSELAHAKRDLPGLPWLGDTPIEGKTILVHAEQGLGDSLQFCRYVPMLAERAAVVLEVPRPLVRLLSGLHRNVRVVATGDPLPRFDAWVPMLSLPLAFGTTMATIPAAIPYFNANLQRTAAWRQRLAAQTGRKVGLVWAGSPRPGQPGASAVDRRRSIALRDYAPLAAIAGIHLISLQKGDAAAQARTPPEGMVLHDWTGELDDFADTAALVEALDLVISVDTSVVHLAGVLGRPVWVLNRYDQCWRWLRNRTDSPWYPSARLFQQPSPGDWTSVIREVAAALEGDSRFRSK